MCILLKYSYDISLEQITAYVKTAFYILSCCCILMYCKSFIFAYATVVRQSFALLSEN